MSHEPLLIDLSPEGLAALSSPALEQIAHDLAVELVARKVRGSQGMLMAVSDLARHRLDANLLAHFDRKESGRP